MPDPTEMRGEHLLITSGPTRAPLDRVRHLANASTGRLGSLIAEESLRRGAHVTFIYGEGSVVPQGPYLVTGAGEEQDPRLRCFPVATVAELIATVRREISPGAFHAVIHAMAVLDYEPERPESGKHASGQGEWVLRLKPTPKVIDLIHELDPSAILVGFKLEVGIDEEELVESATALATRSGASLVVANDLRSITENSHRAILVGPDGTVHARASTKEEISRVLLDLIPRMRRGT